LPAVGQHTLSFLGAIDSQNPSQQLGSQNHEKHFKSTVQAP
jgi:hypothetical protein